MYRKLFLIITIILIAGFVSTPVSSAQLVYSNQFENGTTYTPGTPQYDDWLSFRASLPSADVASITVSG